MNVEFCVCVCVLFQILCYLLPAARLQTQDDPSESGSHAQRVLDHPHIHLLPTHHAKLECHWDRGHCESSVAKITNHGRGSRWQWCVENFWLSYKNTSAFISAFTHERVHVHLSYGQRWVLKYKFLSSVLKINTVM